MEFRNNLTRQKRRFDFDEAAVVEELSQASEQLGPLLESGQRRRRPKRFAFGQRLHDTPLACGWANSEGETSCPATSGGIGQSSMSQIARSNSHSVTFTTASAQMHEAHA